MQDRWSDSDLAMAAARYNHAKEMHDAAVAYGRSVWRWPELVDGTEAADALWAKWGDDHESLRKALGLDKLAEHLKHTKESLVLKYAEAKGLNRDEVHTGDWWVGEALRDVARGLR